MFKLMGKKTITIYAEKKSLSGPMFVPLYIVLAPITQLRMCVIKIVTFKGGHLMWL